MQFFNRFAKLTVTLSTSIVIAFATVGCGNFSSVNKMGLSKISLVSRSDANAQEPFYHGGPVMVAPVNIYQIWYGNWAGNPTRTLINQFLHHLNGTPYWQILNTYYDSSGTHVDGNLTLVHGVNVGYPFGTSVTDANLQQMVQQQITKGNFPSDPNGIYVVYTSSDVSETGRTGKEFCVSGFLGYHNAFSMDGASLRYAFVGDPSTKSCSTHLKDAPSPNNNPTADSMISTLTHEIAETITNPHTADIGSWELQGEEVGDLCEKSHGVDKGLVIMNDMTFNLQPLPTSADPLSCVFYLGGPSQAASVSTHPADSASNIENGRETDPAPGTFVNSVHFSAGNYFVSATDGGGSGLTVDRTSADISETFAISDLSSGDLSDGDSIVMAADNGMYLSAECGGGSDPSNATCGQVNANREVASGWETFTIHKLSGDGSAIQSGDQIALQSSNGFYCSADVNGGGDGSVLTCNRTAIGGWETFTVTW